MTNRSRIRLLISAGADPNLQAVVREVNSITGDTALLFAARSDHASVIALWGIEPTPTSRRGDPGGRRCCIWRHGAACKVSPRSLPLAPTPMWSIKAPAEMLCASYTPMRAAIKWKPQCIAGPCCAAAPDCIERRYERTVQKYLREQSDIEAEAESDEGMTVFAQSAQRAQSRPSLLTPGRRGRRIPQI